MSERGVFFMLTPEQKALNFVMYMEEARRLVGLGEFPPGVTDLMTNMIVNLPAEQAVDLIITALNRMVQARDAAEAAA